MNIKDLIADSHIAFLNQENETALKLAKQAIQIEPKNPDGYKCAGNAYMSLGQYENAVSSYNQAVKYDPNNGNRYFDLGFAQATAEKTANAIKSLTRAEELGCMPENLTRLYTVLGLMCFDIGRYDDALINLDKAEQLAGINLEIMQRKAIIYGVKNDIRNGLHTANQIKLISPSDYTGYKIAFRLLIQSKRYEAAEKELQIAERFATPCMDYYTDCVTLELRKYNEDNDKAHFAAALSSLDRALKKLKLSVKEVVGSYLEAAEINVQMGNAERIIACVNAAANPVDAYNEGFELVSVPYTRSELTDYDVEDMIEEDRVKMADELGEYGLEELASGIEPDEDGSREYFTEIPDEKEIGNDGYRLEETEFELSPDEIDQMNRLYVCAYTLQKNFSRVIDYARKLQTSRNVYYTYMGIYTEANAMKELGMAESEAKYEEIIKFFRNAMMKDPTDVAAVTFRIQAYVDTGKFDEAEQLCNLLSKELRKPLLEKIKESR